MNKIFSSKYLLAGILAASFLSPAAAQENTLYHLTKTIPLGGGVKWDYLHFDPATDRVYISHGTRLDVVDATTGKIVGHVTGLHGSHGIAIDPDTGFGYADSGLTKTTSVFDLKTLKTVKTIPALLDADGMAFDPASGQVYVVGGDANAVMAVDAKTNTAVKTIGLGGSPEFLVADGAGALFVNIKNKNEIVKIDTKTDTITQRWPTSPCVGPVGLAIDPATRRLFASCANATMVVLDADSGKVVTSLTIGKGTDADAFDPATKMAFSSNRDGTLTVIKENGPDDISVIGTVNTAPGARTMTLDPATGRLFLTTATVKTAAPPKHPDGPPRYEFVPGTLKLLIFDPVS